MRRTAPLRWLVPIVLVLALPAATAAKAVAAGNGWLGVYTQQLDDDLRSGLDYRGDGVLVNQVVDGSPADAAGIRKGDVIVSFDDHAVSSPDQLRELVTGTNTGERVQVEVWRGGERRTLTARIAERASGDEETPVPATPRAPRAPRAPQPPTPPDMDMHGHGDSGDMEEHDHGHVDDHSDDHADDHSDDHSDDHADDMQGMRDMLRGMKLNGLPRVMMMGGRGRLGVRIETLSEDLAGALGAGGTKGVVVLEVVKDTPAERAGLHAGDVITRVGDTPVADADGLVQTLSDREGRVTLQVVRRGDRRSVEADLGPLGDAGMPRVERLRNIPGPGDGTQVYRFRTRDGGGDEDSAELRKELQELRQELQQLRQELRDMKKD